jgi:hypothetical protein
LRSIAAVRSEGGGVDGGRKRMVMVCSKGGGVEVDSLKKRTTMVHSEAGVEAAVCSKARDEAAVCSRAGIEDGKR